MANRDDNQEQQAGARGFGSGTAEGWDPADIGEVMRHDLRNPLQTAQLSVDLAATECESEHLETAGRALDRLEMVLEDVQMLARAEGRIERPEPVDLAAAAEACWESIRTPDATLRVDTTATVLADGASLRQLLRNLLRNAVEHGSTSPQSQAPEDAVEHTPDDVCVSVGELDGGFYVADDGPGIPVGERRQVFERGYSTAEDGTGYGLAIVAAIADQHGWAVEVAERDPHGARIDVTDVEFV